MEFIINAFINNMKSNYHVEAIKSNSSNGEYDCYIDMVGVPDLLSERIINLTYKKPSRNDPEAFDECKAAFYVYKNNSAARNVRIVLDSEDYAVKLNLIDYTIRRYYEEHSMIDEINGKH